MIPECEVSKLAQNIKVKHMQLLKQYIVNLFKFNKEIDKNVRNYWGLPRPPPFPRPLPRPASTSTQSVSPVTCSVRKSSTPTISDFPRPRPFPRALPRPLPRPASISTQSVYPVDCRAFVETMTRRLVSIPTNGR